MIAKKINTAWLSANDALKLRASNPAWRFVLPRFTGPVFAHLQQIGCRSGFRQLVLE